MLINNIRLGLYFHGENSLKLCLSACSTYLFYYKEHLLGSFSHSTHCFQKSPGHLGRCQPQCRIQSRPFLVGEIYKSSAHSAPITRTQNQPTALSSHLVYTTWEIVRNRYTRCHWTRDTNNITLESSGLKVMVINSLSPSSGDNGIPTLLISTPKSFCI